MRVRGRWAFVTVALLALVLIGSALAATAGHRTAQAKAPIIIGWAFDGKGAMAPFDGPALAAAQLRVALVNAKGGVNGRKLQIRTCDTQGNDPATAKACALRLLGQKANVLFTTCDVDFAAPVVRAAIDRGVLAIAPCIGTDQMGPKRFGAKGRLAFSFGNVAQDEGSAMAQYAYSRGWKIGRARDRHGDRVLQERRSGVRGAVQAARRQDRREGDVPVARRQQRSERRQPSQRRQGGRGRHLDGRCVRSVVDADLRIAVAREQHADPQLVGRRRHVLAADEPEGDELLVPDVRIVLRRRSERGGQQARKAGEGRNGWLHHRPVRDRRSRHRDQARERLDEGHRACEGDGEVQEGARRSRATSASPRSTTRCSVAGTASSGSRTTCRRSSARSWPRS